eukprot:1162097-Pelagomonas_calceolata.AAC.6
MKYCRDLCPAFRRCYTIRCGAQHLRPERNSVAEICVLPSGSATSSGAVLSICGLSEIVLLRSVSCLQAVLHQKVRCSACAAWCWARAVYPTFRLCSTCGCGALRLRACLDGTRLTIHFGQTRAVLGLGNALECGALRLRALQGCIKLCLACHASSAEKGVFAVTRGSGSHAQGDDWFWTYGAGISCAVMQLVGTYPGGHHSSSVLGFVTSWGFEAMYFKI